MRAILATTVLCLAGCGSEADTHPAPPRPDVAAVHEVCSVTIQPDDTVVCTCVPATEGT